MSLLTVDASTPNTLASSEPIDTSIYTYSTVLVNEHNNGFNIFYSSPTTDWTKSIGR